MTQRVVSKPSRNAHTAANCPLDRLVTLSETCQSMAFGFRALASKRLAQTECCGTYLYNAGAGVA